jgi:hypothetical protein
MDWMCPVDWFDQGPKPNQGSSHYAGLDEVILGLVFIAGVGSFTQRVPVITSLVKAAKVRAGKNARIYVG